MPSVEYADAALITDSVTREYTDPDTGDTLTREETVQKRPFEVRIKKWLKRDDGYHLHGFVLATEFGRELAAQSDPWAWLTNTFAVTDSLTESDVSEMIDGVGAVQDAQPGPILSAGDVSPVASAVTSESSDRFDFEVVVSGAESFDIDWLTVDFDPSRGGA